MCIVMMVMNLGGVQFLHLQPTYNCNKQSTSITKTQSCTELTHSLTHSLTHCCFQHRMKMIFHVRISWRWTTIAPTSSLQLDATIQKFSTRCFAPINVPSNTTNIAFTYHFCFLNSFRKQYDLFCGRGAFARCKAARGLGFDFFNYV